MSTVAQESPSFKAHSGTPGHRLCPVCGCDVAEADAHKIHYPSVPLWFCRDCYWTLAHMISALLVEQIDPLVVVGIMISKMRD